jgi:Tol biopolymer transport system component
VRWSPDSTLLGFVFSQSANNDMVWMIGAQAGAFPTQLSYEWTRVLDIAWLPDSTAMIGAMRDFREMAENRLWQIPLVGSADENATLYLENLPINSADFPRFSPDGQWLAARSGYEMTLVNLASNEVQILDQSTIGNTPAVWSPAGFTGEAGC